MPSQVALRDAMHKSALLYTTRVRTYFLLALVFRCREIKSLKCLKRSQESRSAAVMHADPVFRQAFCLIMEREWSCLGYQKPSSADMREVTE